MLRTIKQLLNRPDGWQRIGVLLSLGWAIYLCVITNNQYTTIGEFDDGLHSLCPSVDVKPFVRWYDAKTNNPITIFHSGEKSLNCMVTSERADLLLKQTSAGKIVPTKMVMYGQLAVAIIIPVALFWLCSYLVIALYRWVSNGFRKNV